MQTTLPNINARDIDELNRQLNDTLTRIYTDISKLYDLKTAVSLGNEDGEIGALTFSATPTQAECEALRDKCEELADDVRNIHSSLSERDVI